MRVLGQVEQHTRGSHVRAVEVFQIGITTREQYAVHALKEVLHDLRTLVVPYRNDACARRLKPLRVNGMKTTPLRRRLIVVRFDNRHTIPTVLQWSIKRGRERKRDM